MTAGTKSKKNGGRSTSRPIDRLQALQKISVQLIQSRDPRKVLSMIAENAVDLLIADACSLYLKQDERDLVFELAINRSVNFDFQKQFVSILGNGTAAYAFRSGKTLRIDDVYHLPPDAPYSFNDSFDRLASYRTRSALVHPLKNTKGDTVGVIQVLNRKNFLGEKWPSQDTLRISQMPHFTIEDQKLLESFAAIAAAAIENSELYKNIGQLFEGFVRASVDAIETRDLVTRGHSERVAILTLDLAEKVTVTETGTYRDIKFSDQQMAEIRYASLLHDFGKIGVRENTLIKAEKLSPLQKERIQTRIEKFGYLKEIHLYRSLLQKLIESQKIATSNDQKRLNDEIETFKRQLESYWQKIAECNRPTVLTSDLSHQLRELNKMHIDLGEGSYRPILENEEFHLLSIPKGSLSKDERGEIELHVTNTYQFLKQIPWTPELAHVPEIAHSHHEMLDGTGYPRRLTKEQIPVQSKIMAICDIFDALVASDRPYKKALPFDKALHILEMEAKGNKLDSDLLRIFLEAKIYENRLFLEKVTSTEGRAILKKVS